MVYLLQKAHVSKPADMPFMFFATGADHVGISFDAESSANKTKRLGMRKPLHKTDHLPVSVTRISKSFVEQVKIEIEQF
jgi:hypothetical protein